MGQAALRTKLSEQEYLEFERSSDERHEFAEGEIFAVSGGSMEHSLIAANIIRELGNALLDRNCRVVTSDMRIKVAVTGRYTYADVAVVCGRALFDDERRDTLLNPVAVFEVLSDSTEKYDRGDKFAQYRTIESLQDYVLVSQEQPLIEHFRRQPDGSWLLRILGPGERLVLESAGCEFGVNQAYLKVFDQAGEPGSLSGQQQEGS